MQIPSRKFGSRTMSEEAILKQKDQIVKANRALGGNIGPVSPVGWNDKRVKRCKTMQVPPRSLASASSVIQL